MMKEAVLLPNLCEKDAAQVSISIFRNWVMRKNTDSTTGLQRLQSNVYLVSKGMTKLRKTTSCRQQQLLYLCHP